MAPAHNISRPPPPPPYPVDFGPEILEALPYENIVQIPYNPPVESNAEDLAATELETLEALRQAPYLIDIIASRQWSTMVALLEAV